jgi:hypothetical protein
MWRNVMPAHTEDTRVDLRRPTSPQHDAQSQPVPAAYELDGEPDDDAPTLHLSRLPWPEPPRNLSERPRLVAVQQGDRMALSRSVGPVLTSRPDSWLIVIGAILIAGFSVFLARPRNMSTVGATPTTAPIATTIQVRPPPPPALIITVGTPPAGDRAVVASPPPPAKTPISVSKLPLAPRAPTTAPVKRTSKPVTRMKGLPSPSVAVRAPASAPPVNAATGNAIDDGF